MIGRGLAVRAATKIPGRPLSSAGCCDTFGGGNTHAGPVVDEHTSLTLPAFFRGVDNLISHLAMLPFPVFRSTSLHDRERDPKHVVNRLLNREPNPDMTAVTYRKAFMLHVLLSGNGVSEIERTNAGAVRHVWPIVPSRVQSLDRDSVTDELLYRILREDGSSDTLRGDDVLHVPHMTSDGIVGIGIIKQIARENLGLALAVNQFAQSFFGNSTVLGTMLVAPEILEPDHKTALVNDWNTLRQGPGNAFGAFVADGGLDVKHLSQTNEASQTIEMLTFAVQDMARWLNVPPPMLMELSHGTLNNTAELARWYVTFGLAAWFRPWEEEFNRKLFTAREQETLFVELVAEGLLRGDPDKRSAFYERMVRFGGMTLNEVRRRENLNGLGPAGDVNYVPLNMTTAQRMFDGTDGPDRERAGPPGRRSTDEAAGLRGQIADAHLELFCDALGRMDRIAERASARAVKSKTGPELEAWADKFFQDHKQKIRMALIPCVDALSGAIRATLSEAIADSDWDEHTGEFTSWLTDLHARLARLKLADGVVPIEDDDYPEAVSEFVRRTLDNFGGSEDGQSN